MPFFGQDKSSGDKQVDKEQPASQKALIDQLQYRIKQLELDISKHNETRKKYEGLKLKATSYQAENQKYQFDAANNERAILELNQRCESTSKELERAQERIGELEQEINGLREQGNSQAQELDQSRLLANGLQFYVQSAQQQIYQLQQQLAKAQQEAHAQQQQLAEARQEAQRLRLELAQLRKEAQGLQRELTQVQKLEQGSTGNGVRHRDSVLHITSQNGVQPQSISGPPPLVFWSPAPPVVGNDHLRPRGIFHDGKPI